MRMAFRFRTAFLRLDDTTDDLLQMLKECFVAQRPARAIVSSYVPEFLFW